MCTFDIVKYIRCLHQTVHRTPCEESRAETPLRSFYPSFLPCEYKEQSWESAGNCPSSLCATHVQEDAARDAAVAEAERNKHRHTMHIRPLKVHRKTRPARTLHKYTTPVADPEPTLLKYEGEYNLDIHKLYTVEEGEELAIDDVHSDPDRWSWTLHTAKAVKLTRAKATQVKLKKPQTIKRKALPPPMSLRASIHGYTDSETQAMAPRQNLHFASAVLSQAHELANTMRVSRRTEAIPHPVPLRILSEGQTDSEVLNLTPRRTSHFGSRARTQANELATTKRVLNYTETIPYPIPLRAPSKGRTDTEILNLTPRRTSHYGSHARAQANELAVTNRVTMSRDIAGILNSMHSGPNQPRFAVRTATHEGIDASTATRKVSNRYRRSFDNGPGVPLAPRMPVRLSAVGLGDNGTRASVESEIPIVHAYIVDEQTNVKPAPRLRRVSRMTPLFDKPGWASVEDADGIY